VLAGTANPFLLEYSCHSPTEERWFLMTATPLAGDRPNGAVIMHVDVTAERRPSKSARSASRGFGRWRKTSTMCFFLQKSRQLTNLLREPGFERIWAERAKACSQPKLMGRFIHPDDLPALFRT